MTTTLDRAARVRRALLEVVAEQGFHGTSMAAVAARAGVATGTAYIYYASKDDLVLATYREVKGLLGEAAVAGVNAHARPGDRFRMMWLQVHAHLASGPDQARFLLQVEASPYGRLAEDSLPGDIDDVLLAASQDLVPLLIDVPLDVLYDLGFGPAVRLAARDEEPDPAMLTVVAHACWSAVTA